MSFDLNTDWKLSAKGNWWRKATCITFIVDSSEDYSFGARVNDDCQKDRFEPTNQAKTNCEQRSKQ